MLPSARIVVRTKARRVTRQMQAPASSRTAAEDGMSYKRTLQASLTGIVRKAREKRPDQIDEEELYRFLKGGLAAK